jgi:hypothetical protein
VVALASLTASAQEKLLWGDLKPGPHAVGYRLRYGLDPTRRYDPEFTIDPAKPAADQPLPILIAAWYPARKTDARPMDYRQYLDVGSDDARPTAEPAGKSVLAVKQTTGGAVISLGCLARPKAGRGGRRRQPGFQERRNMTLRIEGSEMYRQKISELLRGTGPTPGGIAANPIGQVILGHVESRPQQVTITRSLIDCNARTGTVGRQDDASPKGQYYYPPDVEDNRNTLRNERYDLSRSRGTGKGAGAVVEFSPGASTCTRGRMRAAEPDVVLLHELVHALRKMQGLENSEPLDATLIRSFGDAEEWLAILVENVYGSAQGQTRFRGGHDAQTKLQPPEDTSEGFLNNPSHRELMRRYYHGWRPVFGELASVPARFNPFRAYTLDPVKYGKPPSRDAS